MEEGNYGESGGGLGKSSGFIWKGEGRFYCSRICESVGYLCGAGAVEILVFLRTGTAGLLVDKKRCGMCKDSRCVMCDSKEVEDLVIF